MPTAVAYYRISDREQSNYSISGQRMTVTNYATRKGVTLLNEYEDEGFSAKDFNRPSWKQMVKDLRKYKPDFVYSTRYNRMSRQDGEGLVMVKELERKYGCIFVSVEEMAFVDTHSPMFHKMRGDIFVTSEYERRVIQDQTMFGRYSGHRQGKFLNKPPYGYLKSEPPQPKSVPQKDPDKVEIINLIGRMYHEEGVRNWQSIRDAAEAIGFDMVGRSSIKNILHNPLYYGLIRYRAYKREPGGITKGLHEAYFPVEWWHSLQVEEQEETPQIYKIYDEQLPLRRLATTPCCGTKITGGRSKGGMGVYYASYKCNTCNKNSVSARRADKMLNTLLDCMVLSEDTVRLFEERTRAQIAIQRQDQALQLVALEKQIAKAKKTIETMDYRFLTTQAIAESTYQEYRSRAERDLIGFQSTLESLVANEQNIDLEAISFFSSIKSVVPIYDDMKVPQKQRFLTLIFGQIELSKQGYRTSRAPLAFKARMLATNYLSLQQPIETTPKTSGVLACTPKGREIELVKELIDIGRFLKKAA